MVNKLKKDILSLVFFLGVLAFFNFFVPVSLLPKGVFYNIAFGSSGSAAASASCSADAGAASCGDGGASAGAGAGSSGGDGGPSVLGGIGGGSILDGRLLCSVYANQSCSSSNVCGSNQGTIGCDGVCNAIAPAVPSNYGRVCLVSNVCGQSNQGTIGCDGSCTVKEAPALPSGYGTPCQSSVNSCGQKATGIIGCVGLCTATTPSDLNCTTCGNNVCNSSEDNSNCPSDCPYVAPATPTTPAGEGALWTEASQWTLTATPNPIFANTRTTVSWSVSGATGCTLVGVGAVSGKETDRFVGGPALDYQSSKLQENTDFTLTCSNAYSGRKDSKTVTVKVRTIKIREF
ncbi:MAG: hypothetical protein WC724_00930 [Candidatus Paceibacterota bacterium]|jgi:hypothetical protein